jgi:alpha-L-rhamnosidase
VRSAFTSEYVGAAGRVRSDCQTVYALALCWDLLDTERQRLGAGARLVELVRAADCHVSTGLSWLYPVAMGATTIWERWDALLPDGRANPGSMTSFNHYAYGATGHRPPGARIGPAHLSPRRDRRRLATRRGLVAPADRTTTGSIGIPPLAR